MTWSETHRRWQALQEVETLANAGATELPWNPEYAEIFGDREELAAALHYRWNLTREAQLDTHLPESVLEEQRARLEERNAGVIRLLRAGSSRIPAPRQDSLPRIGPSVPSDRVSA
ncbi:hypothetical protein EFK50_20305 [Nocardioides marmoriginsengisoli]|uniref:Uncharacterized protein n=1 Tax=Nocardioides marmoriginsengisoli TaxID=661483 RepID=A0A3N0CC64_9ACTN|nr:hypothetical protein [Nocardioides marmoriginsengisoli]RNL60656.1 hypothetical protein EFK50_20305 [Nocardioides marmoriginsengisoli]